MTRGKCQGRKSKAKKAPTKSRSRKSKAKKARDEGQSRKPKAKKPADPAAEARDPAATTFCIDRSGGGKGTGAAATKADKKNKAVTKNRARPVFPLGLRCVFVFAPQQLLVHRHWPDRARTAPLPLPLPPSSRLVAKLRGYKTGFTAQLVLPFFTASVGV